MKGQLTPLFPDAEGRLAFRSAQCALCHHLGAEYGPVYRLLAGPDLVFLALLREAARAQAVRVVRRSCVVAPVVTSLPVREASADLAYAAAVGVWMAVEKLRDDWQDEGGWWRWLAWRAFRGGQAHAEAVLAGHGLDVGVLRAGLVQQAQIEAGADPGLAAAAEPTRSIAAATFGLFVDDPERAATLAAIGHHVGGYLFWVDNLLDLPRDVAGGGYNALARHFHVVDAAPDAHTQARDHALAEASAEIDALADLVAVLPEHPLRAYVRNVLVSGFRDKLRRYRALAPERLPTADLPDLLPPRVPLRTRLAQGLSAAEARLPLRARVALVAIVAWVAPRAAWAADWWPEGSDPELEAAADTGAAAAALQDNQCAFCDACCSNFGWISFDCNDCCEGVCDDACGDACSGACG